MIQRRQSVSKTFDGRVQWQWESLEDSAVFNVDDHGVVISPSAMLAVPAERNFALTRQPFVSVWGI
jgi:hypothetical protein